jgi:maltooligosyltrehalose trehalohydrolase
VLRFFAGDGQDRLVIVNFGRDLRLEPTPEPLPAPPEYMRWETQWSSEDPCHGGLGTPPLEDHGHWRILGEAAVVMFPRPVEDTPHG